MDLMAALCVLAYKFSALSGMYLGIGRHISHRAATRTVLCCPILGREIASDWPAAAEASTV